MALVTLQRSPSPSNDPEEDSAETGDDEVDGRTALRHKRSKSTLERLRKIFSTVRFISKLRPCLSESYFTVKGAALILPHSDLNRKTSRKNHGGEIQQHLQSMLYLLRPEDKIKVAIRLENQRENEHRYMALVSTIGRQDTEESVILGLDCTTTGAPSASATTPATPPSSPVTPCIGATAAIPFESKHVATATIGLVLPLWMGMKVRLSGDGGFSISLDEKSFLFKPVSVQAMWSAIQSVDKALHQAEQMKYLAEGLTHTWVDYYRSKVDTSNQPRLTAWNLMEDVEIFAPASLGFTNENESEKLKLIISAKLKEVMMSVDLDEATSRSLRQQVEQALNMKLDQYRNYFDEELIRILGQMDAPSQILDFLYLGSEWNASNLEELQKLGIKYILNVTREIDNFFIGMFHYCNVRLYDQEDSELMKHWLKTYKFINKARKHDSKVLVHCKMGISRSASTVVAYLMKENRWPLDKAFSFVKERRNCVRPNKGFMDQLRTYEGILNASNQRDLFRSKSEQDLLEATEADDEESTQQGTFLGNSLFRMMSGAESLTPEEEILLRKDISGDYAYSNIEPDFETDSRSADSMEESVPDMPSPLSEQTSNFPVPHQDPVPRTTADEGCPLNSGQMLFPGDVGSPSRIKPDSSWIKLECPGESSTDPAEDMDLGDADNQAVKDVEKDAQTGRTESALVVFQVGSDGDGEASSSPPPPKINIDSAENIFFGSEEQQRIDMGIHQYYGREQIPWRRGKVRKLREGVFESAQISDSSQTKSIATRACALEASEDETFQDSEQTLLEAVRNIREAPVPVSQCESCLELSSLEQGSLDIEEDDTRPRSVYEREEIPLTPGTVQRTRQEIEQRQKLYGETCDQSLYGMRSIRRSSSLRGKRESSKNRNSERRKTCTPIVSPPPEKAFEMEELNFEGAVLKLDFQVGESTTDDIEMMEDDGGKEEKKVTVYTFGADCVPVKEGIVRRHKQEIESKSGDSVKSRRQFLLAESSGEDTELTGPSVQHQLIDPAISICENIPLAGGFGYYHNIPTQKPQWSSYAETPSSAMRSSELAESLSHQADMFGEVKSDREGDASGSVSAGRQKDGSTQQQMTIIPKDKGVAMDSLAAGSIRSDGYTVQNFPHTSRIRYSSESSAVDDSSAEVSQSTSEGCASSRSYSHPFSPAPKQVGKNSHSPETLAVIREIGSAFVNSPAKKEELVCGGNINLVKHLVKNIEGESKVPRKERKIIIIDSSSGQDKTESGSALFTSADLTTSAQVHADPSQQSSLSRAQVSVISVGESHEDCKNVSQTPLSSAGGLPSSTNPRSISLMVDKLRSGNPLSVVRHLRGKFESHSPYCDSSDGEQSLLRALDISSHASALPTSCNPSDAFGKPVPFQERKHFPFLEKFTRSKSAEVHSSDVSESLSSRPVSHVDAVGFSPQLSSQSPRHPLSTGPISDCSTSGLRHDICTLRERAPFDRGVWSEEIEERGAEGVRARQHHGKTHPLSHLQQQRQEVSYPSSLWRHSPFHSTM